jgi:hypothetical protein
MGAPQAEAAAADRFTDRHGRALRIALWIVAILTAVLAWSGVSVRDILTGAIWR